MMKRKNLALFDTRVAALLLAIVVITPGCGSDDENVSTATGTDTTQAEASEATTAEPTKEPTASETQLLPEPPAPDHPRKAEDLTVKDGFLVERLHMTDKPIQGSWVAICKGPDNTLFVSSQYQRPGKKPDGSDLRQALYQIKTPAVDDHEGQIEIIPQPVDLNGAQGLCYAFGSLYVMESMQWVRDGPNVPGHLLRVTDSDGDGLLDKREVLFEISGGGEHGTHAIVPTPDGEGLYIVAGNMTPLPKIDKSRPVKGLWSEDHVLAQNPDGKGHARGLLAPGGWICRVDPDGKNIELIASGFRNQYDIGVDPNGEVFAYDADMEYDLGQPWYRPTRINHAVSGAEFGWRNGTGKWPTYYEDSVPASVEIGPGSPVGVIFGTGADFPTKYQQALYVLDWTYGIIYATHLEPDGASYTGTIEPFVKGKPLPVTDVAIADDGHMYFTAGGRRGDSALYRVSYYGVNDKATPKVKPLTELAQLRKQLEALHSPDTPAEKIGFIWENLGHEDRFIRFAARVALEHQPIERWIDKAKAEEDTMTQIMAGLALARHRHAAAMDVLAPVKPETEVQKLAWARAIAVAMARKAMIDRKTQVRTYDAAHLAKRDTLLATLQGFLPSDSLPVNTEIIRLRVALNDPTVVPFAMDLMNRLQTPAPPWLHLAAQNDRYGKEIIAMRDNPPPSVQLGIAFMLRNMTEGWTPETRQAYFAWLNFASQAGGGLSYPLQIKRIREQAIATLTDKEKQQLAAVLEPPKIKPRYPMVQPKGPGRKWTTATATKLVEGKLVGRDFMRGAGLYQSAQCWQCHQVSGDGSTIGPQLTTAANKFSIVDLMRATIEPSHEISDQYAMTEIVTKDGKTIVGRMIEKTEEAVVVMPDQRQPENTVTIPADQIESENISKVSTMPAGLIDALSAAELRDLTAYILSGGNPEHEYFKDVVAAE